MSGRGNPVTEKTRIRGQMMFRCNKRGGGLYCRMSGLDGLKVGLSDNSMQDGGVCVRQATAGR